MARDGSPDDPNNYSDSDPTQYANYGGTGGEAYSDYQRSEYGPPTGYGAYPPPEPTPWYRKPAALVGLGVLTAIILALLVYAIVKFTGSGGSNPTTTTTTTTPTTSTTAATSASVAPPPGVTQTVTESPTATQAPSTTSETPVTTTTEAPSTSTSTSTSTTVSTSVSTVTETVTTTQRVLPTFPLPRPGG